MRQTRNKLLSNGGNGSNITRQGGSGLLGNQSMPQTRYNGIRTNESILGTTLPILIGQQRLSWKLLWYGNFYSQQAQQGGGGSGLGKNSVQYVYFASVVGSICMGPCANFLALWDSIGRYAVDYQTEPATVTDNIVTPVYQSTFKQDLGVGLTNTYTVTANDYGSPGTTTTTGIQRIPLKYTTSITPGPGEYTVINTPNVTTPLSATTIGAASAAGACLITGTFPEAGTNAYAGYQVAVTGSNFAVNNGQFKVTASSTTTLTVTNSQAVADPPIGYTGPDVRPIGVQPISGVPVYTFNPAQAGADVVINYVAFRYHIEETELDVIQAGTGGYPPEIVVQYQSYQPVRDVGVTYYPSGVAFTRVAGIPGPANPGNPTGNTTGAGTYNPDSTDLIPGGAPGSYIFSNADIGAAIDITYIYNNLTIDTTQNAPGTINLSLFGGELGQTPWSYLTSGFEEDALGYSEVCYIAAGGGADTAGNGLYLGYAPVLPQYNFEVLGPYVFGGNLGAIPGAAGDANPAIAIYGLLTNPEYKLNFPALNIGPGLLEGYSTIYTNSTGALIPGIFIYGNVSSGTFTAGEEAVQAVTGAAGLLTTVPVGDSTQLTLASLTGPADGTHVWTGQTSTATFTPSAQPASTSASAMWVANNFFISDILDSQTPLMNVLSRWCEAGQCYMSWDEGLLKFTPLYDTTAINNGITYSPPTQPIIDLDDSDFVIEKNQDPIKVEQTPWQNLWNRVQIKWDVRINDYNEDILQVQDEASVQQHGLMMESPQEYQFICFQQAAQFAANMRLQRYSAIYTKYSFTLKTNIGCFLSPGDIITITDGLLGTAGTMFGRTPCRITKMTDDPKKGIIIEAENFPWSVGASLLQNKQANIPANTADGPNAAPGDTNPVIFEVPNRATTWDGDIIYIFANGSTSNWGGYQVWVSYDGIEYNFYGQYSKPGRIGTTLADYPTVAYTKSALPVLDSTDTLTVQMNQADAQLLSVTGSAASSGYVTLSALKSGGDTYMQTEVTQDGSNAGNSTASSAGPNTAGIGMNTGVGCGIYGVFLIGTVTAWFWYQNGSNVGIWQPAGNPSYPVSTGSSSATAVGNSLLFNQGAVSPATQPIEWATLNSVGNIVGNTTPWEFATNNWCMAVLFELLIPEPGNYTFLSYHDDGMFFGFNGGATRVSGPNTVWHSATPVSSYNVLGGVDQNAQGSAYSDTYVINFPSAMTYSGEIDFFQYKDTQSLSFTVGAGYSPYATTSLWSNANDVNSLVSYASVNISTTTSTTVGVQSQNLDATQFGFSVPAIGSGIITGVQVNLNSYVTGASGSANTPTLTAQLIYQGNPIGNSILVWTTGFPTTSTPQSVGNASSLSAWGLGVNASGAGALSATMVNDPSFGVRFIASVASSNSATDTVNVNDVQITITWAAAGAASSWLNPNDVNSSINYASSTLIASGSAQNPTSATQWLYATDCGFKQAFGFVLTGIGVSVSAYGTSSSDTLTVSILYNNLRIGSYQNQTVTTSPATYIFGGAGYLWTQQDIDVDAINDPSFGVALQMTGNVGDTVYLDDVQVTIYGDSTYNLELISYETATLSGLNTYQLTNIQRGVYGSYPCDHPQGATFARMDQASLTYTIDPTYQSTEIYFKFLSFNAYGKMLQTLSEVVAFPLTVGGLSPGAIDADSGALRTGIGVISTTDTTTGAITNTIGVTVPELVAAHQVFTLPYGIQNIPSGYGLLGPANFAAGPPIWVPVLSGGGGSGSIVNLFIVEISANFSASAWDYVECFTTSGAITVTLPQAAANPNVFIGIKKMTSDANAVTITPFAGDTVELGTISILNESIIIASDGVSNWAIFSGWAPGGNFTVVQTSTAYTAVALNAVICNSASAGFSVTLPLAEDNPNTLIAVQKNSTDTNVITIVPSGTDTVQAQASLTIASYGESMCFISIQTGAGGGTGSGGYGEGGYGAGGYGGSGGGGGGSGAGWIILMGWEPTASNLKTDSSTNGTLTGAINNANTTFTTSALPITMIGFFWNGQMRIDYTLVGQTITTSFVPNSGDTLIAVYFY